MRYNRYYITWWWTQHNDWLIDVKFTKKTTTITQLLENKPLIYSSWLWNNKEIETIRLKWLPKVNEDWSFVIYHKRAWTPFIYEPIKQPKADLLTYLT